MIFKKYLTGGQDKRGVGTKYKREETKLGLTSLNIGIFSISRSRLQ